MPAQQTPDTPDPAASFDRVREDLLDKLLVSVAVVALPALIASLYRMVDIGWQNIMVVHIISYAAVAAAALLRRRLRLFPKALIVVSIGFVNGVLGILFMGLIGSGGLFMMFTIILATMFIGVRLGGMLILVSCLLLLLSAFGFQAGFLTYTFSVGDASVGLSSWVSRILVFVLFSAILIMTLGRLITHLLDSSNVLERRSDELKLLYEKLSEEFAGKIKTEQALQQSESKYRLLAENASDVIWTSDLNDNVSYVSPSVHRFLGYTPEEFTANTLDTYLTPNSLEIARDVITRKIKSSKHTDDRDLKPVTLELESICKDGSIKWSETTMSFLQDPGGRYVGILGASRDITERKRSSLEKQNLQKQLMHSQKMEAIGTLAGGIAHDFNNILSAIVGYAELIQLSAVKDRQVSRYLDKLLAAGDRAKDLIRQILTFSRQTDQERKPVSIKHITEEALSLLEASLPSTISLRVDLASESLVMADPTQIHQIVMNLCTNAGHAMEGKEGVLDVRLDDIEDTSTLTDRYPNLTPGSYIQLVVKDTGHGISPESMERIFEPFYTTKDQDQGSGLGLAVIHGIVESLGGVIDVESEPGVGTVFYLCIPRIESVAIDTADAISADSPGGNEHILLVDDEPDLLDIGEQTLIGLGYQVTSVLSPIEALDIFQQQPERFDLVITDYAMPRMAGDRFARQLLDLRKDIPIILCTGYGQDFTREKAAKNGFKGFLMKPIHLSEIAALVRKVLDENVKASESS